MKVKSLITKFFGLHDQEQRAQTTAVLTYGARKKEEFEEEMARIQAKVVKVYKKQLQTNNETAKLIEVVDGITAKIMTATGGKIE